MIDNQIVTWTAFAILAMFLKTDAHKSLPLHVLLQTVFVIVVEVPSKQKTAGNFQFRWHPPNFCKSLYVVYLKAFDKWEAYNKKIISAARVKRVSAGLANSDFKSTRAISRLKRICIFHFECFRFIWSLKFFLDFDTIPQIVQGCSAPIKWAVSM